MKIEVVLQCHLADFIERDGDLRRRLGRGLRAGLTAGVGDGGGRKIEAVDIVQLRWWDDHFARRANAEALATDQHQAET
jgi:hypothetical protein